MRGICLILLATCAMFVSGGRVSAADEELATVEGAVEFKGKALPEATITFHLKDDQFVGAKLTDGKFRVDRVPTGTLKVTIQSKKVPLPAKYASEAASGLTVEVKKGKSTVNFALHD